jgi:lipid A 3-O-deacylase
MTVFTKLASLALVPFCAVGYVAQASAADNGAITITLENDILTGSDNNYTNGLGVSWVSRELESYDDDKFVSKWSGFWEFLPFVGDEGYTTYASWTIAQEMHTPDDITIPNPPASDQPYAGVLYIDSVLYARSERWTHAWELKLGVVGPASQADDAQKAIHDLVGGDEPMGWDTQLSDEPIINVGLTTAYLLAEGTAGESARWRLVPVGNVGLGTYFTGAGLGMYGEFGWNLVEALGGTALRDGLTAASTVGVGPVEGWSVSFFGGIGGHAVAHYLPLDGTVFEDSRSVDTKPFIGSATIGLNVRHDKLVLSLATTFTTKAFETQEKSAEFGTLSVSWFF